MLAAGWAIAARLLWPTDVPDGLDLPELDPSSYFTEAQLEEARDYERLLRILGLLSTAVLIAVLVLYARRGEGFTRESAAGRIGTGMLLGMLGFAIVWLAQLPFGLITVWWQRKHDVAEVGYVEWAVNSFFALGGVFLFICLGILVVMALAGPLRQLWWVAAVPVFTALGLGFAFLTPFLLPVEVHPLRDRALEASAEEFARAQGEDEIPVDVAEVKEYTTEPNAAAAGLGPTRRVILWDTLLEPPFTDRQVEFILAHEVAHHSRDHLWKGIGWFGLFAVPVAFALALTTRGRGGMYEPRAVPLALLVVVVLQFAVAPLENAVSRRTEAEADWVALETARDPAAARAAFRKLAETSLSDPDPPDWAVMLEGTHPPIMQRIAMAEEWKDRNRQPARSRHLETARGPG